MPRDGDSSLSDPCSGDGSNESHGGREVVKGVSSRSEELTVPVEQSAYKSHPSKDDSIAMQPRSESTKLEETEILRQKEIERVCIEIREIIDALPDQEKVDLEDRTEILNTDRSAVMEMEKWNPYFLSPDIGLFKTTLKGASWEVEEFALQAASSVVGLQSLAGGNRDPFYCSGTIVESSGKTCLIITVANLVKKCPEKNELAEGLKINVYLQNQQTCEGQLLYHDFYYNICVIQIKSSIHLPKQRFSSDIKAINFDENCSRDVVTLGREKESHALVVSRGEIIPKNSNFDCEELLVSTCRISKADVGGPLMNFDGVFIGLNYYHYNETPFIPSFIVLKCLQQLKLLGKVMRPWVGFRVRTLFAEGCTASEKMQTSFSGETSVIIEKICKQSSAELSGLNLGDIIDQVNGVYCSNTAELGGILLDIGTTYLLHKQSFEQTIDYNLMEVCIKFGVRGSCLERTVLVSKSTSSESNKWPFPKPIIVRRYERGIIREEEWYAMES